MTSDRLENYRAFQSLVANLGPTILHDRERTLLLDAAEGLLLSDDTDRAEELVTQGNEQLARLGQQSRDNIMQALTLCGPRALVVN